MSQYPEVAEKFQDEQLNQLAEVIYYLKIAIFNNKEVPELNKVAVRDIKSEDFAIYQDKLIEVVFRIVNISDRTLAERIMNFLQKNSDIFFAVAESLPVLNINQSDQEDQNTRQDAA